jgi:hypothetical protein
MHSLGMSPVAEALDDRQVGRAEPGSQAPAAPSAAPQPTVEIERAEPNTAKRAARDGAAILEFAVFGGLLAGAAGIVKATQMDRPADILLCLLGSLTGCGLVCYFYFRRE